MDLLTLHFYEKKILIGLVDFYFSEGYKIDAYNDPSTGGIYENILEVKLGLQYGSESPSPDFILASKHLEDRGFIRRFKRIKNNELFGVWPTRMGIYQYEYWKAPWHKNNSFFFIFPSLTITR